MLRKTKLAVPDVLPITLTRTYRPQDPVSRAFGIGAAHPYDLLLVGDTGSGGLGPYTYQELVLPDDGRIHFDRSSSGSSYDDAVYEAAPTPTLFHRARMAWNGAGWTLTRRDGPAAIASARDRSRSRVLLFLAAKREGLDRV